MQNDGTHNGQKQTRKEFRKEKAKKNGKGLVTPDVKRHLGAALFRLVLEGFKVWMNILT